MLGPIPEMRNKIGTLLIVVFVSGLVSCATQKEHVALVNDPDAQKESQIPWDKQEKWEVGNGQLANVSDHR
jgi:hypothetical protein